MFRNIMLSAVIALLAAACQTDEANVNAAAMLCQSRQLMSEGEYDAARDTILSMRVKYPTAVAVRAQAILVLDSLEIMAAADSLQAAETPEEWKRLDVKKRFFERKLMEDLK